MGADAVLDPAQGDVAREVMAQTGGRGVDCAMDCAAKQETMNEAFRAAANGARVVLTGIHSGAHVDFEVSHMRRKELAIFNVRRSNHESEAALELVLRHPALFGPLVTHTRGIEKIAEAFKIAEHYADGVGKMIVKPGE
jgi:threonine dehydrogenase-like Zn-dependent dehydrogenase